MRVGGPRTLLAREGPLKTIVGNVGLTSSARLGEAFDAGAIRVAYSGDELKTPRTTIACSQSVIVL